jgi:hypothetical protein
MKSILMISLHGYVAANAELGKPDTGGQVVYVLELADRFSRLGKSVDLLTRKFEDQPEYDQMIILTCGVYLLEVKSLYERKICTIILKSL